jgi:hypothetical protein
MSVIALPQATRFRLRFMTQELDLAPGEMILGRSDTCDITLFDPLVSRQHASITVDADQVVLKDLGSRNGTRVNGKLLRGLRTLRDGDRVGLGKNEFVFKEVAKGDLKTRTTGSLVYCAGCQLIYPREAGVCPHCASTETLTEVTRSGVHDEKVVSEWALRILIDVLVKALEAGEEERAERLMSEAMVRAGERVAAGKPIDPAQMKALAAAAYRLSELSDDDQWARWADRALGDAEVETPAAFVRMRRASASRPPSRGP